MQAVQTSCPGLLKYPALHATHEELPVTGLFLPAGQSVHVAAAPRENFPTPHESQKACDGVGLYCPARQSVQDDAPAREYFPEAQMSQVVLTVLAA